MATSRRGETRASESATGGCLRRIQGLTEPGTWLHPDGNRIWCKTPTGGPDRGDRVRLHAERQDRGAVHAGSDACRGAEYLWDRNDIDAVDAKLRQRLRAGDVILLDVRPRLEYETGHISGARSVRGACRQTPRLTERGGNRGLLPRPYCVFGDEAVSVLRAKGYRARRLAEGFPDWRSCGFPVETGAAG